MFWAFSLSRIALLKRDSVDQVSMLNVLSFFFMYPSYALDMHTAGFDAQCSELFLYGFFESPQVKKKEVSMLNVLSFFFIILKVSKKMKTVESFDAQCSELFLYKLWE